MKRFFMTLAAMLLLSIGTFAQVGGPLKGDVNGDGKVDVEDVTSVVNLILSGKAYGYFYFGTTQPTAENYQMLSGLVASYTSIGDAIGATASIDAGQTLYMLCPATWMKGKKVDLEDGAGSSYNFIEDIDAETVSGYVIYRTQAWEEATDLTLNYVKPVAANEYYWYVGQTNPSSMSSIDPIVDDNDTSSPGWRRIDNLNDSYSLNIPLWDGAANIIVTGPTKATTYVALPNETLKVRDSEGDVLDIYVNSGTKSINGVTYFIYQVSNLKIFNGIIF